MMSCAALNNGSRILEAGRLTCESATWLYEEFHKRIIQN